ncbi:hypothetical protein SAMN04488040_0319 [Sulfitobacter marinus]|uniref:Uncharacterized protein n=1 Tax=Sulfitobacter marinus TaxID=394264 RepID=A0A1I6PST2_9RHOB|nr:hypothetical protein SAMN04488040_0319 [Sulfitobacter marinus]
MKALGLTNPPLLKERRIPTADDDIKVIGLFHIRRLRPGTVNRTSLH